MTAYTGILVRDSLSDTGIVPSPGLPYTSPDVICVQQNTYADPASQFGTTASYSTDPNLSLTIAQNNNFYVRGQNLGSVTQGGTMYLYWSKASLLLTPNLWFNQPLTALLNGRPQNYVALPPVPLNGISVGNIPFNWTPPAISANDHFCLIGAVNTIPPYIWPPAQTPSFSSSDDFVLWVRNNPNICWRNLSLVTNPNIPQWDRLDSFSNPWLDPMITLATASYTNVPVNTVIKLQCTALGLNFAQTVSTPNGNVLPPAVMCPPGFNGLVETTAVLPNGAVWPIGAMITTTVYVARPGSSPVAHLDHDFGANAKHPSVVAAKKLGQQQSTMTGDGVLVEIGNTTTAYQPSA